jgi:hypothetical protein
MTTTNHSTSTRRLQTAFQLILYEITVRPWPSNTARMLQAAWRTLETHLLHPPDSLDQSLEEWALLHNTPDPELPQDTTT